MSANPKHPSTTKSTMLLWMIFLSPVVGALTFVLAGHYGLAHLAIFETTVAALAAWWLATYPRGALAQAKGSDFAHR